VGHLTRGLHRGLHQVRIPGIGVTRQPRNHATFAQPCGSQWARQDSNLGPTDYDPSVGVTPRHPRAISRTRARARAATNVPLGRGSATRRPGRALWPRTPRGFVARRGLGDPPDIASVSSRVVRSGLSAGDRPSLASVSCAPRGEHTRSCAVNVHRAPSPRPRNPVTPFPRSAPSPDSQRYLHSWPARRHASPISSR
jgi:hypothetical protein